ncbi:hypothetical protein F1D05_23055 [Kribbella qitaiheensis]|uniref:VCBS repeat-containing protein n=1 Tax=Kribbella qitaiheensis TaxID=1544730 RepID=A0A7G6X200_9ACTN|nr:hypothetical protein [Kribbella qitaiheensis]QNE20265.1 hypothetical protein F1D05_23055 [Kribbella qitaiheensis]
MRTQLFSQVITAGVAAAVAAAVIAVPNVFSAKPAKVTAPTAICTYNWYLSNSRTSGTATIPAFAYGNTPMVPLAGNWDGAGGDTPAAYSPDQRKFFLTNSFAGGVGQLTIAFGNVGDRPIIGDWNGDGTDEVGVYTPSTGTFTKRAADGTTTSVAFGAAYQIPLTGDWNGDGIDDVGVYRAAAATFDLRLADGTTRSIHYGDAYWKPMIGDWNGDGPRRTRALQPRQRHLLLPGQRHRNHRNHRIRPVRRRRRPPAGRRLGRQPHQLPGGHQVLRTAAPRSTAGRRGHSVTPFTNSAVQRRTGPAERLLGDAPVPRLVRHW